MADMKSQTQNIDVLCMGSSRVYRSVNAPEVSKQIENNMFNLAYDYANFFTTYYLLQEACKTNNIETLYLEVSMTNFTRETSTEDVFIYNTLTGETKKEFANGINLNYNNCSLLEFTNYMKNFSNGRFVNSVKNKVVKEKYLGSSIAGRNIDYKGNGYLYANWEIKNDEDVFLPASYYINGNLWDIENVCEKQIEAFYNIIDFCEERNINVVLFSPPYPSKITQDNIEEFKAFDSYVKGSIENLGLKYLDFSKLKKEYIELTKEYFYNANHNNGAGASKLAPIYAEIYEEINNDIFNESDWFYLTFDEMSQNYN